MALSSMTGFARMSVEADGAKFSWELKSVNARGLEIRLRLPSGYDHLESDIRSLARERLSRGSCFFSLQKEAAGGDLSLRVNEDALALVVAAARRLAAEEGIAMPTADGLLSIPGVLSDGVVASDTEAVSERDAQLMAGLGDALKALIASRQEEGARLATVIEQQIATIAALVDDATTLSDAAPEFLRARIREQVAVLTADSSLDPDRLHQEAVLAATRADVREELDRLRSHIEGARALLAGDGPVGRKLDFLTQEFNREANTLCSKAFDKRLTTVGIEMKAVIDQLREQVQNLA